jgi:hypothetical protein
VGIYGFNLARDAVVEVQVIVCECVRSEVAQIVDSLRCVSEGTEHSDVNFPGFAVLTKTLLTRTGLPALSTVELPVEFLSCTDVVGVHLLLSFLVLLPNGSTFGVGPLVVDSIGIPRQPDGLIKWAQWGSGGVLNGGVELVVSEAWVQTWHT